MSEHPNAKRHWLEWETDGHGMSPKAFVVIETDLSTTPGVNGLDSSAIDDMIDAVRASYEPDHRLHIAGVRIVPAEKS